MQIEKNKSLLTCFPDVAKSIDFEKTLKAHGLNKKKYINVTCLEDCAHIAAKSNKKAFFKCLSDSSHPSWDAAIVNRVRGGGCPRCAKKSSNYNRTINDDYNLLVLFPDVAKSIDFSKTAEKFAENPKKYINAKSLQDCSKIAPKTCKRAIFRCFKNPEHGCWDASVNSRTNMGNGCPQCYGKRVNSNHNLLVNFPEIAGMIDFEKTLEAWKQDKVKYVHLTCLADCSKITPGTHKYAVFQCPKIQKHVWSASINSLTSVNTNGECPLCSINNVSKEEEEFKAQLVKLLNLQYDDYDENVKIIPNYNNKTKTKFELDFVCKKLGIAVEFNGTYWHSDKVLNKNHGLSAIKYHKYKADEAKKLGLTLLFVWDADWLKQGSVVLSSIKQFCDAKIEVEHSSTNVDVKIPEILRKYKFEK